MGSLLKGPTAEKPTRKPVLVSAPFVPEMSTDVPDDADHVHEYVGGVDVGDGGAHDGGVLAGLLHGMMKWSRSTYSGVGSTPTAA